MPIVFFEFGCKLLSLMALLVILGKGRLVHQVASWFHSVFKDSALAFVPTHTDHPALYEWNNEINVHYFESISEPVLNSEIDIINLVLEFQSRLPNDETFLLSLFHNQIIPSRIVRFFNYALNLHLSPLPKYRGTRSINFALVNNEPIHGVTVHKLSAKLDQGDILGQLTFPIYPKHEEVYDIYCRSLEYGLVLLKDVLKNIRLITPRPQIHADATYYCSKDFYLLGDRLSFFKSRDKCDLLRLDD